MKLNLEFYKELEDTNVKDANLDKISEYVNNYDKKDYENIFDFDIEDDTMYNLSKIRNNVLNWYNFDKNSNLLELGCGTGEITDMLCSKVKEVVAIESNLEKTKIFSKRHNNIDNLELIVGELKNIKINNKFDYIVIVGLNNYLFDNNFKNLNEFIIYAKSMLKQNGKILFAIDNKFALKFWAGKKERYFSGEFETLYNGKECYSYSVKNINKTLEDNNIKYKKYYPLPDHTFPNVIFSDLYLPDKESILKYFPWYKNIDNVLFNEIEVFRQLIKDDEKNFSFFANSYIYECKLEDSIDFCDVRGVFFNNHRKSKYRLITKIKQDVVEKEVIDEASREHFDKMKNSVVRFKGQGLNLLDEVYEDKITSKFVKNAITVDKFLFDKDKEFLLSNIDKFKEMLMEKSTKYNDNKNNIVTKYLGDKTNLEMLNEFNYIKYGFWDAILQNCFYINKDWYFFDQEWMEENVPVEFILYRTICYSQALKNKIEYNELLKYLSIEKYEDIFKDLDNKLQEEIIDKNMWKYFIKIYNNPFITTNNLNLIINEKSINIEELNNIIKEKEKVIEEINIKNNFQLENLSILKSELEKIHNSRLWKISRLLKKIK